MTRALIILGIFVVAYLFWKIGHERGIEDAESMDWSSDRKQRPGRRVK